MTLTENQKKALQTLLSDIRWGTVEEFTDKYLKENFIEESVKRDTEFNTIWYAAYAEGGKHHIQKFLAELENQAQNIDE